MRLAACWVGSVRKRLTIFIIVIVLSVFVAWTLAKAPGSQGFMLSRGDGQYSIWQHGFFRIKFMREGAEAVPSADLNNNGCPDFVEDVAVQLLAAHYIFCEVGGFSSPLESPRYKDVRYIYVVIRGDEALNRANGLAFDEPDTQIDTLNAPRSVADNKLPKVPVLTIGLNRKIDPQKNFTPAHEYFHQIQNGMTYFKNPWFYEGMAVWAETALSGKLHSPIPTTATSRKALTKFVSDTVQQEKVLATSYRAYRMIWQHVASFCPNGDVTFSREQLLQSKTFAYTDGSPVIKAERLQAGLIMRQILERLDAEDNAAFARFDYKSWTETNQRRKENNSYIVNAVEKAVAEVCSH